MTRSKMQRVGLVLAFLIPPLWVSEAEEFPIPAIPWNPRHYVCYRTVDSMTVDGRIEELPWQGAPWTEDFVDIEGSIRPKPRFRTRAKMLWNDHYFYIAAALEEPHVWATLTQRDVVIFQDNDFEVFIDPDGDTHKYYELEINAYGTEWDLFLGKPYRDGGPAITGWDIHGLLTGVHITGTINQPEDTDQGLTMEIAIPWKALKENADRPTPPSAGDQWRVNFSRVEWRIEIKDGRYTKLLDPLTGSPLAEDNWVWSPQGLIAMHYPEMWGFVQFSDVVTGHGHEEFVFSDEESAKWILRQIYYKERLLYAATGRFTSDLSELNMETPSLQGYQWPPDIEATSNLFEVTLKRAGGGALHMTQDGHTW